MGLSGSASLHAFDILDGEGKPLVDRLPLPHRIGVHADEVDLGGQWRSVTCPPYVVVGDRHRLLDGALHLPHVGDDPLQRHHVVVPVDQRFVADVDRDHDVVEPLRELDAALDLGSVLEGIGGQLLVGIGSSSQAHPS